MQSLFVVLILCLAVALPLQALQAPGCDPEDYATLLEGYAAQIRNASGDDAHALVLEAKTELSSLEATCAERVFEGSGSQVKGPITFGSGVFVVRGVFEGFASVLAETVSGDCDPLFIMIVNDMSGGEAEAVYRAEEDCVGLMEVTGIGDWTVTIEQMS